MSVYNDDNKDFEELMQAIRDYCEGDGSSDRTTENDSLENRSLPSYEVFESDITHTRNVQASVMLARDPNLSINQMSWNDTSISHVLATSKNDKLQESASGKTATNDPEMKNVNQIGEVEGAPIQWVALIIILSVLVPFVAYIVYKILQ